MLPYSFLKGLEFFVSCLGGFAVADDSIKIQRLPYPVAGIQKIKELNRRREKKEGNEFNEYLKDTMEKEKEENKPLSTPDIQEGLKGSEETTPTEHKDGAKIDITV